MKRRHIIYVPGLGDRMGGIRSVGLWLWRRPRIRVTLVPMRWTDAHETYEQKLRRIRDAIGRYPGHEVVLAGESAGGAMAIVAMDRFKDQVSRVVTICGMNQGAGNVNPKLYDRNHCFRDAMQEADRIIPNLTDEDLERLYILYSSRDNVVRPKDTLIRGARAFDLGTPLHQLAILSVLYLRTRLVTNVR